MELSVINHNGFRVLTTKQISMAYEVEEKLIRKNFENNKNRYEEGKHYVHLQGEDLKAFLHTQNLRLQNQSKVRHLYLWTEKGALLHAKSLNTDKAWEVYEYLVDFYFRAKEQEVAPVQKPKRIKSKPAAVEMVVDTQHSPEVLEVIKAIRNDIVTIDTLLTTCEKYPISKSLYDAHKHSIIQTFCNLMGDINKFRKAEPNMISKL